MHNNMLFQLGEPSNFNVPSIYAKVYQPNMIGSLPPIVIVYKIVIIYIFSRNRLVFSIVYRF